MFLHIKGNVSRETLKYAKLTYVSRETFIKNIKIMFHVKHLVDKYFKRCYTKLKKKER